MRKDDGKVFPLLTLYGRQDESISRAAGALDELQVPYHLEFAHALDSTPCLDTPAGSVYGVTAISKYAKSCSGRPLS